MWLKVGYTSNDMAWLPILYYTNCLSEVAVCPQVLRADCGTENGAIAATQMLLCRNTDIYTRVIGIEVVHPHDSAHDKINARDKMVTSFHLQIAQFLLTGAWTV